MASVNKVILIGNLGRDPEIRYTSGGTAVVNFSIATSETWKDKQSGEKKTATEWHKIVFWGKQAEVIGQYMTKGSSIYVEGKLKTRKWNDEKNNGIERYTTEIEGKDFKMMGGNQNQQQGQQQGGYQPNQNQNNQGQQQGGFQNNNQQPQNQNFQQGGNQGYQQNQQNQPMNQYSGSIPEDDIPF